MALAATPLPVGAGTAPVLDVDSVMARLPAEARARVAWARKPIDDGLLELRTQPLTDELVASAVARVVAPLQAIGRAAWQALASNIDEYRAALMQDIERDEARLGSFIETEDSRDTLMWIVSLLQSFFALSLTSVPPERIAQLDESMWTEIGAMSEMKPLWRGLVAVMAAIEEAKRKSDAQRARDLLDVAFLELTEFRNIVRRLGAPFPVFPFETTDERRRQLRHYAERLRGSLTEDDAAVLDGARLHDLR